MGCEVWGVWSVLSVGLLVLNCLSVAVGMGVYVGQSAFGVGMWGGVCQTVSVEVCQAISVLVGGRKSIREFFTKIHQTP